MVQYNKNRQKNIDRAAVWKKNNKDKINEVVRLDRIKNPEKYKKWHKDYRERHRERINTKEICRQRGISVCDYEKMVEEQNGLCAICQQAETRLSRKDGKVTRLCIDHDHATGNIRKLLCHDCNTGLGKFKDCPELMLMAIDYLLSYKSDSYLMVEDKDHAST